MNDAHRRVPNPNLGSRGLAFKKATIERFDVLKERLSPFNLREKRGCSFAQRQLDHLGQGGVFRFASCRWANEPGRTELAMSARDGLSWIAKRIDHDKD